ncbi:hypothetical protein [Streptomyces mangrovisoli]|uniref:Uncharacterized protein n=1 Tax=Streptomyces mangrovisoli TaxID=1428628 RepID=A0A1J4NNF3_9ACTN|nr:hypothetical protein [Streptomyces mangrovisoli]OIJ63674.1 hypothetical protein WN71_033205 [Streptomyces mangrovisoli]
MELPYVYRVTKYDPADHDRHGHCTGTEDTVSDHRETEAAYLLAVRAFAVESGVDRLHVREPQVPSLAHCPCPATSTPSCEPSPRKASSRVSGRTAMVTSTASSSTRPRSRN